jgi:hypothetical protein
VKRTFQPFSIRAKPIAEARWLFPPPVKTASQCRVSGVRGPDPLSVSSSMRPDGAGRVPAAVRRRGSPGRGSARRHARSGPVLDGGGSGWLCHSHHVPSVIGRSAHRVARTTRYASSLLRRGIGPARRRRSCAHDTTSRETCSRRIER